VYTGNNVAQQGGFFRWIPELLLLSDNTTTLLTIPEYIFWTDLICFGML